MNILRTIRISLKALNRNKMRSFLTALGIIIGVGSVIAMVSIGQGAKNAVEKRFEKLGTNLLFVSPGSQAFRGRHYGSGSIQTLTPEDAKAIEEKCNAVQYVSPSIQTRTQTIYRDKNWNTTIQGSGENYALMRNWPVEEGSFFTEQMVKTSQKVCILGNEVKQNLFEGEYPIDKIIRIKKIPFRVLGVLESRGETGGWFNMDDMIIVPYTTAMKRLLGTTYLRSIEISAINPSRTNEAIAQIQELLRIRHKIAPGSEDDFHITNMSDIAEGAAASTKILTILLGGIASVSLLVGGIGIMNIMLVSVTERIREIGIRMSVGARARDILLQFLTEAVVLSVSGGLVGILVGIASSQLISHFGEWKTSVSISAILLAFSFAGSVGIFFGFYPARKASKLDPIEALRYE